jgi:GTP-binding protein
MTRASGAGSPPIVAVVGRPNVGKSTLFNRYAGAPRALVANQPGITRDRIAAEIEVGARRVLIVDTAGLDPEASSGTARVVQEQARAAVAQADAILFVVDGQAGWSPEDAEIANELRRTAKPVAVAVNKIDAPVHEDRLLDFYRLGLEPLAAVSAEHGRGAWDLLETLCEALPDAPDIASELAGDAIRVALVGRPNAGKSSLMNRLVGEERVAVSEEPGTTRDAVDVLVARDGRRFLFVDTAGLRRPGRRGREVERGSAVMTLRSLARAHVALVLFDAASGITDQDIRVLGLARERGCAVGLLLNKWDLVAGATDREKGRIADELERRLRAFGEHPVLRISALTGKGVARVWPMVVELAAAASRRIPTAELNRWLADCVRRHEPAMAQRGSRRKPVKFFYATQTGIHPPRIALFCSEPDAVKESYLRFLENRFRDEFGVVGVPIRLQLRPRRPDSTGVGRPARR